ncbi:YbhB/YbcL family Raf kinase inhibitor-like protein [Candidatus Woesearchaeota archaeon]|nr:YbhB/YbcL family Raf kinase inhibitor-like protein [Candidatus Woesearchaeota archaeon]
MKKLTITSSTFKHNGKIPSKYTCDGENVNPPLKIEGIPSETKSLVLIMDDPDAIKPAGKVWDHWIVFNIPPKVTEIHEHEEPEGRHGKGTGGNLNYKGPCPPDAEHRYFFKVYALNSMIELPEGSAKAEIEKAMNNHILAKGELIGVYERKK